MKRSYLLISVSAMITAGREEALREAQESVRSEHTCILPLPYSSSSPRMPAVEGSTYPPKRSFNNSLSCVDCTLSIPLKTLDSSLLDLLVPLVIYYRYESVLYENEDVPAKLCSWTSNLQSDAGLVTPRAVSEGRKTGHSRGTLE